MDYQKTSSKAGNANRQHDDWDEVHSQLLAIQKKSLEVSDPNDADEKEADAVARKVVDGEMAEIHGASEKINRKGEGAAETTPGFQSQLENNTGGGQSLDDSTRSEMESKMGADFSGVKIHTGSEAHAMNESVNAKAFTHGQDIFFRQGEFDTTSKQGKELLAHELVHTKQQSSGISKKIQREVWIGGVKQDFTEAELTNSEVLRKMNATTQAFKFKDKAEFDQALKQRQSLIDIIFSVMKNNDSVEFASSGDFHLPEDAWQPVGNKAFIIKENVTPAYAVKRIFDNGDNLSVLDCNTMVVAAHYRSILQSLGDDEKAFNDMFPAGKGLIISQTHAPQTADYPTTSKEHPFIEKGLFDENAITTYNITFNPADPTKDLIPGDWVYFSNVVSLTGGLDYTKLQSRAEEMLNQFGDTGRGITMKGELDNYTRQYNTFNSNYTRALATIDRLTKKKTVTKLNKNEKTQLKNAQKQLPYLEQETKYFREKSIETSEKWHPAALRSDAWQGEQSVYLGNGRFGGFGIESAEGLTYKEMQDELFSKYKDVINAYYDFEYWETFSGNKTERDLMKKMTLETLDASLTAPQLITVRRLADYSKIATLGS